MPDGVTTCFPNGRHKVQNETNEIIPEKIQLKNEEIIDFKEIDSTSFTLLDRIDKDLEQLDLELQIAKQFRVR